MIKYIKYLVITSMFLVGCSNEVNKDEYIKKSDVVDPMVLYEKVTAMKTAFYEQYGSKYQLPENAKRCAIEITKNSDTYAYMGTKEAFSYRQDSQYSKDGQAASKALDNLMNGFKDIGFIKAIENSGKTPALMFDIDNTIQLSSFEDDYFTKAKGTTPGMLEFIQNQCFKDGVDCYFITARYCNVNSASTTESWLKTNLKLTYTQIKKFVFLSGAINDSLCALEPTEKVAYKDTFRRVLSEQRNVYWLMSIGDQMTDWFGPHSGLKVWYPNQMFHSDIVSNNYDDPTNCALKTVVAPSDQCYAQLKGGILEHSTIGYCKAFADNEYYEGNKA